MGVRDREIQTIDYDVDAFVDDFRTRVRLPAPPLNPKKKRRIP